MFSPVPTLPRSSPLLTHITLSYVSLTKQNKNSKKTPKASKQKLRKKKPPQK